MTRRHFFSLYSTILLALLSMCFAGCRETEPVTAHRQPFNFWGPGYNRYKLFVYKASIVDSNSNLLSSDTLGLYCPKQTRSDASSTQWEFMTFRNGGYYLIDSLYDNFTEATNAGDSSFYVHPYRYHQYQIQRFSPNPYFENKPIGSTWEWRINMGKQWAIPGEYEFDVDYDDSLAMTYYFSDTPTITTFVGPVKCNKIDAISISQLHGRSTGTFYWNNSMGMVSSEVHSVNGKTIKFDQIYITENMDEITRNKGYMLAIKAINARHERNKLF